ncbi:MAG: chorismate synthase [Elusimicrobia bacterium HGW-Elusimicrobia-1]|jgi:chorismate synthase|nr:MAG: chorismate synthase [Elusimicrobia bacterium HGW-Elusimicrobia-1]
MMDFATFGESHGKVIGVVVEGLPAGLEISVDGINAELSRRQSGYGRGARMAMEKDTAEIVSGVRWGRTIGSPVCVLIKNRDWDNNRRLMSVDKISGASSMRLLRPRPGHADLAGLMKYRFDDVTDVLERSSARETAARVAAGALFKKFLSVAGIGVYSWVEEIGGVKADVPSAPALKISELAKKNTLSIPDAAAFSRMAALIDSAKKSGDTVGGVFAVAVSGTPAGLGGYVSWKERLDGKLAAALMSIQAIKGVEIGAGFRAASTSGSKVHDEIFYSKTAGYFRKTNNAGGLEGGVTNGGEIRARCAMKPIPSLTKPLASVDIATKKPSPAAAVRSDVCAVPAAAVVGEAMTAFVIAAAVRDKFGGDSVSEFLDNLRSSSRRRA